MSVDIEAAERFVLANARIIDRRRLEALRHDRSSTGPVLDALRAYRNPDGGFGHALEPDVRGPESEPASTLRAVEILTEIGVLDDPMIAGAAAWVAQIAGADGGVPFVMPEAAKYPRAPWMVPTTGGSFLTFALVATLNRTKVRNEWLERATTWCWRSVEGDAVLGDWWMKYALSFLDSVSDDKRASPAIERFRPALDDDGSVPVPGGADGERITPVTLSERPTLRSRRLFTAEQVEDDLDRLERGQQDDGGWTFDWLGWSPGQSIEWRGAVTVNALATLGVHGRLANRGAATAS